jgi:hypothetical protein
MMMMMMMIMMMMMMGKRPEKDHMQKGMIFNISLPKNVSIASVHSERNVVVFPTSD